MNKEVNGKTYLIGEAFIDDVDLSLMTTDMASFQKSVFASSVSLDGKPVNNPSLKVYLALMPSVMEANGFGGEEGND